MPTDTPKGFVPDPAPSDMPKGFVPDPKPDAAPTPVQQGPPVPKPTVNQNMALAMSGQQAQMAPEEQAKFESGKSAAIATGATAIPVAAALGAGGAAVAPAVARGIIGSSVVGSAGQYYGNKMLGPTAGKVLGTIGGLAGGYAGVRGTKFTGGKLGFLERLFDSGEEGALAKKTADVTDASIEPQDLITRMKKLVIPGEQPTAADLKRAGDLTQAPQQTLQSLAKFGDKLAQNEINRRLLMGKIPGLK